MLRMHLVDDCDYEVWRFMNKKLQLPVYDTGKTWRHKTAISAGISLLSLAMIVSPAASAEVVVSELMYHPYSAQNVPENIRQEYIELFNRGTAAVNLSGWRFSNAVNFVFPDVTLGAGRYLVVAADVDTFKAVHPGVSNVVGGWDGKLSNSGERIELVDSIGVRIDSLRYADQGDWGVRELGPVDRGHRGWLWISEHDGAGKSMELINPALPNEYGQNWTASNLNDGTPGAINSAADDDIAPL
ncbi:MAG: lamin tail domain-containing protein, partial [Planctomycetota bacterium]